MKTFTKQLLQILVLIAAMLACVLNLQAQNMSRYITMTVQNGQLIKLDLRAAAANTPVRVVSGSTDTTITVGTSWTDFRNYTAGAGTMTVYGDITGFDCSGNSTKLTAIDVTNNTALKVLYCGRNQLTAIDVTNNTALKYLYCYGNQLDACALDQMFRTLPQRQASDNAKVYIKDGVSTNPGTDGCRTPIANAKNWEVMDYNGDVEINNTTFTCVANMSRYITMTVQNGQQIRLDLRAAAANTPVRVVSGSTDKTITVGTSWTGFRNYTAGAGTMTVYGDITGFDCRGNSTKLTAIDVTNNTALKYLGCRGNQLTTLDVSNNTALTVLYCGGNQLTTLDVSNNTALTVLYCGGNQLDACALDQMFRTLPERQASDNAKVFIKDGTATNPGVDGCQTPIANAKNWKVMDYNGDVEINNTTFTCANMSRYITMTVQNGQQIKLDLQADAANTPVRVVSGSTDTTITVGTSWTGVKTYTAGAGTMTVYGDITGFNCSENSTKLTAIDVTNNTALKVLYCSRNQLTAIDVSNNTALTMLYCYGNQLTALDVTNNTALTVLYCRSNQLTTLDVSNNTALNYLSCDGNQLDACALDQMFRTLPERQASDNAKVYIKDGVSTNPGTDGCRTPIANAKNWKVMDWNNGSVEINNTTFTCANMSRYITMTVQNGQQIKLDLQAAAANTPVRVVSGSSVSDINVGTNWTNFINYTAGASTMTVYGDITGFDCSGNSTKLTAIDVTNNTALKVLYCGRNQLTAIDVTNNTALKHLSCYGNQLDACALDQMFRTLPERQASDNAKVIIKNETSTNPDADGCQTPIANAKNWKVMDWNNGIPMEINNTTFTCVANMSRYITMTVQNGQQIKLDLQAAAANTPVRVVSGTTDTTFKVGTSWTGYRNYTAGAGTMTVYGDITGFDCSGNSTKLTAIDVTNNTALTRLYCGRNQLTTLDVTNNTALKYLYCYGNQLDACALDQMFRTLPERQASDNAKVFIKYGISTNPGADGCRTPIANAKNWKVMDYNGNVEINNTTFTCANMERYITMTVQNGQQIGLNMKAATANTPVRVVSGTTDTTFKVGTSWTEVKTYTAGAGNMTVYGDITGFGCRSNSTKLTALDVTNNTALTQLYCYGNQLTALDVTNNTALTYLYCYGNQLTALDVTNNTALTQLYCNSNQLTTLDVTNNTALTELYCYGNQLTALDVTNNTALTELYCYGNQLTALDVTNNTALTELKCYGNQLTALDVTNNTALTQLNCYENQLTALDVTNNTALTELSCSNNQLTTLDITNNTALTQLVCYENQLTALDVTNNTALTYLDCDGNQLTAIDVSNNTALTQLYCNSNQLTTLDVTNNTALTQLDCSSNQLTTLDVTNNTALTKLYCYGNQLDACALDQMFRTLPERQASDNAKVIIKNGTSTNPGADGCRTPIANAKNWKVMDYNTEINNTTFTCVANMSRYITMTVQNGQQIELDLQAAAANTPVLIVSGSSVTDINVGTDWTGYSNYTAAADTMTVYGDITGFNCSYNSTKLTTLDVTNNTALTYLSCEENQLTALNVTNNTALTELYCYENQLTALDVTNNTALTQLDCSNNQLTTLDVTNNTALTDLSCSNNQLTTLDITNNTALTQLYCYSNQLTTLDVTNNTALTELYCTDNQLTTLDVTSNTALTSLYCYGNQLDACALDQMFRTLPERQASDNAKVFIKYGTITNPGVDGCRTPIANAKNWKVMDYNGNVEINNTTFTCANMERYITMTVQNGQQIRLDMKAATANTPVRIVSGSSVTDINVGTSWTGIRNFTASADTMTVYGDITAFNCKDNQSKLTAIDVRKNTTLTELDCSKNQLTTLDVSNNTALTQLRCYNNQLTTLNVKNCSALKLMSLHNNQIAQLDITGNIGLTELFCNNNQISELNVLNNPALKRLDCYGNLLNACALEGLFHSLPTSLPANNARVFIKNGTHTNPGADGCLTSIANAKNWKVMDWNNGNPTETNNTISACVANMSRYITMTVQNGQQIQLDMKAATANTPVRVVSGSSVTNILVETDWTDFISYTAAADTMTVYGDITGFDCSDNSTELTAIDVTNNTALTELYCYSNQLTALDVTNNTALTELYCYSNQLTALDVTNNTALTVLDCYENQLTTLDVTNNTALTGLECYENQLTALDVTNNTALTRLDCDGNQLTTLDVTNNTALTALLCSDNQLTTLDVTNNTALTRLYCSSNQLTALNVTNNTALTELYCSSNQLTTLDVTNNTALTSLYCYGNQLDACALDQMFRTLPERQASDNAKVFIKDGTATNPGVDGCQTPIANAKNWKVMDYNGNVEINNTTFTCANMNRYITMTVQNGQQIKLNLQAAAANTPVRIVSGSNVTNINVGTDWTGLSNYTAAADTMTVYGDITGFDCSDNSTKLTTLDVSNNTALTRLGCDNNQLTTLDVTNNTALTELYCTDNQLTTLDVTNNTALTQLYCSNNQLTTLDVTNKTVLTELYCSNNQLTTLDVTNNTALTQLECYGNQLDACALDQMFRTLPERQASDNAKVFIKYGTSTNPGVDGCQTPIANAKNWKVMDLNNGNPMEINNTTFTCTANMSRYITMTVQNGQQIKLDMKAATANTPVRVVSGSNVTNINVGTDWTGLSNYTAAADTMTVYGDITGFDCSDNSTKLTAIDVSNNTALTVLNCYSNQLTAIDVTNNTALTVLNCYGNQLTAIDVSNNAALTGLYCGGNQLTAIDVTSNTALTNLYCHGNQLDACALDQMFSTLPQRQASDNAKVIIKNGTATNPGVDGCQTPIANAKNWKVMDAHGNVEINNTTFTCVANMSRYITMTVQNGQQIRFGMKAEATGTLVRVINGANDTTITVGTDWTFPTNYTAAADTMTVYGDITGFDCSENSTNLTALNVTNNTALTVLNCYSNQLTAIDVTNNTALTVLNCYGNQLTAIDVTSNTALTNLYCHGNQLTAIDVTSNTALTSLHCSGNQLTTLDVTNNTALTVLKCYGNQLDACALDQMFRTLPERQASDSAKVIIKNGTYTNPGADGCQTPIANAKNWKVMDAHGNVEINNTTFTCTANMSRYITMTVQNGQQIKLDLQAAAANTLVRVVSGTTDTTFNVGTSWTGFSNYTAAADTMIVYGDITGFDCRSNSTKLTALDVTNNTALKYLYCYENQLTALDVTNNTTLTYLDCSVNQLTTLDVSNNTALTQLRCYGNLLDACALDQMFRTLPERQASDNAKVFIKYGTATNPGVDGCQTPIANAKNWKVMDASGDVEINNTTFTCVANMSRYITMTVQNGQQIRFGMKAEATGTLVRVINGANDTTITVGTDWTFPTNYTAASDTIKVYGDITGFDCSENSTKLTTLDVTNNTALTSLYCYRNQLTALDVSNNAALTELNCGGNQLATLDVTNNTALTKLNCASNQLTTLDVTNNTALIELNCNGNQLTTLDVTNNTALTGLGCSDNQLTALDVTNNTALTVLNCASNQLTTLDVSNNTALTKLNCGGNQLTAIDVTNNTALTTLNCYGNQLTAIDVTSNTALTNLYCHGNLLDACALDQMFSTLPQRQASDNAKVIIKNGTSTNPGADGCRTPIANAKNWKVMDASGDVEINNTTFTCANMERYITMNVQNGEAIQLKLIANEANTPIRIVSGANDTTVTVGTAWTDFANYTAAADTMKVFGDIVGFDCSGNTTKINAIDVKANTELTELNCSNNQLTALDVSNNIALTYLNCSNNQLTALDVSNSNTLTTLNCSNNQLTELYLNSNSDLSQIYCFGNQLDDCALDGLFRTLPTRQASDSAKVVIKNGDETNPGADGCQTPLANAKNWKVVDGNGNVEINNTTFTCTANMNRYITSIVQNGAVIMLNLMADAANTPISIVSGTNIKDTIIGTNWTGTVNFTANTDTVIVYGNIAAFDCGNNQTALTKIELNNNNNLKGLYCYNNQITTLDLSSCTNLQILNCNDNQIPNIDVTNNTALTELYCQNNQITELNLNNNSAVISLECKGNQLSTLNVSNNTALKNLRCDNNQITSLNVNNNPDLITLHCGNNMINSLELSNNSQLINFACNNNQIRALDLSNNNALTTLNCSGNMLSDCALDSLFRSLPTRNQDDSAIVVIKNEDETNPGADGCRTPIANAKNWKVMDWNNGIPMEINNTTFTCQEVNIDNILTDHVIKLYPNPVNSELYIATDAEVRIIQVFNMNGVEVARKFESNRIDLNHLQPNTYIVRITTDINSSNQFVVKQ